jgi:hypothetical protein
MVIDATGAIVTVSSPQTANSVTVGGDAVDISKLLVNSTLTVNSGAGTVTVDQNGTLSGTGSVDGNVIVWNGGNLAAGASPGTLTVTGDVTIAASGTMNAEIDGTAGAGVAGGHDQLVAGAVNLEPGSNLNLAVGAAYANVAAKSDAAITMVNATSVGGTQAVFSTVGGVLFNATNAPAGGQGQLAMAVTYTGTTVVGEVRIPADFTGDDATDASDLNVWNDHAFGTGPGGLGVKTWATGDSNGDGVCDASDLNLWNDYSFLPWAAAASEDLGEAPAAVAADEAEFVYNAADGSLTMNVLSGLVEAAVLVETPLANVVAGSPENFPDHPLGFPSWNYQWFNGKMQFTDSGVNLGDGADVPPGSILIGTLLAGLTEADFGEAEYGTPSGTQFTGVTVIPVPEPGTLLLLLTGFGSLLLWRRR